jgi:hypothetical protein
VSEPITHPNSSRILRASIWVAIGALIAAAVVCVVWVLLGDANGMIGKAFLTILLLAAFAGVAILEANLAARRPAWFALASMIAWVVILLIGAFLIWMPENESDYGVGFERFMRFLLIVLVLQGALLHIRLFSKAHERHRTTFTSIVTYVTIGLVAILAAMLVLPLLIEEYVEFRPFYWRVVVAIAILAAVGTALVPLVNALFAPKKPRPLAPAAGAYYTAPAPQWPTYADGATPLPVLPDGSPDWNAYYTGQPTYPHGYAAPQASAAAPAAPQAEPATPVTAAAPADDTDPSQRAASAPVSAPQPPVPAQQPETPPAPSGYQGYPPPPPPPHQ